MLTHLAIVLALLAGVVALAADTGSAVIVNSGSTNTAGFKIVVPKNGSAEYTSTPRPHRAPEDQADKTPAQRRLDPALVQRFYSDLEAARPFSDLPTPHCMKSASFGSRLTIQLNGEETPDLSCPVGQNSKLSALAQDAKDIVAAFQAK